jgi:nuclear pore complex protein Nup155
VKQQKNMLGSLQPNLLLSPTSKQKLNLNLSANSLQQSAGLDDKSLKDIIQILDKRIENVKHLTEFSKTLQVDNINNLSLSGHTDFFYPNLAYQLTHYQQELPEISKVKHIPIPNELVEQFSQMELSCYMGLFTCISRAWLTIDNLIFFWNYEDGSDICFYDSLTETILAVELFVPKPGTFEEGVEYALCLATTTSVILLSIDFIRFTKGNGAIVNEMRFSPTPVYSIPTDNLLINTIKGSTATGRLFMGAKDGCLYEFFYQVTYFGYYYLLFFTYYT